MKLAAALLAAALAAACAPREIELGTPPVDAALDTPPDTDAPANPCRCRIPSCRDANDCIFIGGECGADMFCVGDFGACRNDSECQATMPGALCTASATSTSTCGS